jgi:hypothetical protein
VVPRVRKAHNGRWAIHRNSPNLHVIFGWLQIGEVINVAEIGAATLLAQKPWLRDHPHPYFERDSRNTIYIASDRLVLPGIGETGLPGAGEFGTFDERLVLMAPEARHRSRWALPSCFAPDDGAALPTIRIRAAGRHHPLDFG